MTQVRETLKYEQFVSTHMPLARHDVSKRIRNLDRTFLLTCLGMTRRPRAINVSFTVSTHMPLARHDSGTGNFEV